MQDPIHRQESQTLFTPACLVAVFIGLSFMLAIVIVGYRIYTTHSSGNQNPANQAVRPLAVPGTPGQGSEGMDLYWKGRAQMESGQYKSAVESYSSVLEASPTNVYALADRAYCWFNLGEYDKAIGELDKVIDQGDRMLLFGYSVRGNALSSLGRYEEAIADCSKAIALEPEMEANQSAAFDKAYPYFVRGYAYENLGHEDKALKDYRRALEIDPDYSDVITRIDYMLSSQGMEPAVREARDRHLNEAVQREQEEDWERALVSIREAEKVSPDDEAVLSHKAYILRELEQYEEAIQVYDRMVELNPRDYNTWYSRGYVYAQLEENEKALDDFNRALELDPENSNVRIHRRHALISLGRYQEAIKDLNDLLEDDPRDPVLLNDRAWNYAQTGEYDRAMRDIRVALAQNAESPYYHHTLGFIQARQGDLEGAVQSFTRSITKTDDECALYFRDRAKAYLLLERFEEARADLNAALALISDDAELHALRAMAFEGLDQPGKAADDRRTARELDPEIDLTRIEFTPGDCD